MIGRAFGKPHNSIHGFLAQHGGIVPPVRRRSLLVLTAVEREDISRGLASGSSIRDIAKALERAASTVSREIAGHGGRPEYRAQEADRQAWESALRPKRCLLAMHVKLRKLVASKLILDWSPEQVSGWLKIQYPADESMRVSHETIYRSLFIQARGVLKKQLLGHLRSKRRIRRSQHARVKVYFCDPHSPWQRGTNENTNRLLRQYLPKRTDLSSYTQSQLDRIALRLNQRPRKTLGFQTPANKLRASVASTI